MAKYMPLHGKVRILFLINSLESGGAEKVLIKILNGLNWELFSFDLALLKKKGFYIDHLPSHIKIFDLGVKGEKIRMYLLKAVSRLTKIEKKYDIVFSLMWESNIVNLMASLYSKKRRIISERINLSDYINSIFSNTNKYFAKTLTKFLYKRTDMLITPSEGVKSQLIGNFKIKDNLIRVIPNPLDLEEIRKLYQEEIDIKDPYFLYVGRLHEQKNIPLLLKAFRELQRENIKLLLIGEGQERDYLTNLARKLQIMEKVIFKGFQNNPYKYMNKAICLVLPSNFEAFPNVLIEAMATGCPVVSTDCSFGPSEIIENEKNGILVPVNDLKALKNALNRMIYDSKLRTEIIKNGIESAEKYDVKKVVKYYEKAIFEVYN